MAKSKAKASASTTANGTTNGTTNGAANGTANGAASNAKASEPSTTNPNLKRKSSRWLCYPDNEYEDIEQNPSETDRYSLLLFIRNLDATEEEMNVIQNACDAANKEKKQSNLSRILNTIVNTKEIARDYWLPQGKKLRRLDMFGNTDAEHLISEYTELISLASYVWTRKEKIDDQYQQNLRLYPNNYMDDIWSHARNWSETRYRYLHHALRDDPIELSAITGAAETKGSNANTLVHESGVLQDSVLVEYLRQGGVGFSDADRRLFERLYRITPDTARSLEVFSAPNAGLRIGLSETFAYIVRYIDVFMNWRRSILESARKVILAHPTVHHAGSRAAQDAARRPLNAANARDIAPVDNHFRAAFVPAVNMLIEDTVNADAFYRASFDALTNALFLLNNAVRNCPLNTNAAGGKRGNRHWNQFMRNWPQRLITRPLIKPTGTSMIAGPRPT